MVEHKTVDAERCRGNICFYLQGNRNLQTSGNSMLINQLLYQLINNNKSIIISTNKYYLINVSTDISVTL